MRARALRAPVFLSSLPPQTGRCAPLPRPSQLRCFLFDPQKYIKSIELGPPRSRVFFFPQRLWNTVWGPLPPPRPSQLRWSFRQYIFLGSNYVFNTLTACCITDMHINDIHISVILSGFSRGPSLFLSIWGQNYKYTVPRPSHCSFADPYGVSNDIQYSENPSKCPSLAKNPPKYTTAYLVQQSNCRWHCEPTCFSSLA